MKKVVINIPDKLYEKTVTIAEKLNITFDELCAIGVKRLAEEHLKEETDTSENSERV